MNTVSRECLICTEQTHFYCQLKLTTSKYSEEKVYKLLQNIIGEEITEESIICQNCLMKIDEYDLAITTARKVEQELKALYFNTLVKEENEFEIKVSMKCQKCNITFASIKEVQDHTHDADNIDGLYKVEYLHSAYETEVIGLSDDDHLIEKLEPDNDDSSVSTRMFGTATIIPPRKFRTEPRLKPAVPIKRRPKIPVVEEDPKKEYMCDVCGATMQSRNGLVLHIKQHQPKDDHKCTICGKTFTQRGALVRHYPIHTGVKPYQCDKCGKQFLHYSSFHMHELAHDNIRAKKCEICGLGLRSTSHLTRHLRIHSGEKPFACPTCGQRFAQRYNMTTHFKVHQGIHRPINKTHKCLVCQLTFPRKLKLDEHMKIAHQAIDLKVDETDEVDMTKEELSSIMLQKSIASLALPHMSFAPN